MSTEALKLALEALSPWMDTDAGHTEQHAAYYAIKQALEQPAQEPVAILKGIDEYGPVVDWYKHWVNVPIGTKLYTTPPAGQPATEDSSVVQPAAQPAVALTDEQIDAAVKAWFQNENVAGRQPFAKRMRAAIEAAHGIKENT